MRGFVVIEGIDGCGKSSVARLAAARLGKGVVLTREPTDSWLGKAVRRGAAAGISPYVDALLFMADRAVHTEEIKRLLTKGKLVISDRYYHSTVAYQAAHLRDEFKGDVFSWLLDANLRISVKPDVTILLTIPPELGLERVSMRGRYSRFERLAFLKEVSRNYVKLARLDGSIVKIDAARPLDVVVDDVVRTIRTKLSKGRSG